MFIRSLRQGFKSSLLITDSNSLVSLQWGPEIGHIYKKETPKDVVHGPQCEKHCFKETLVSELSNLQIC